MIFETERLYLREMNQADFDSLCKILQDEDTMYAYEGAFSDKEVQEWLDNQISRYQKWKFGLWAVILKETDELLSIFAIVCTAIVCGKLAAKIKLPAILGWLIAGIIFGPYLVGIVTLDTTNSMWYKVFIKFIECFAGVMIGREIIFKKIASSGKQIIGITFVQSIGTFLFVSVVFGIVFFITDIPVYLAFIFGGIALATAPAPALSIVNEYHTSGPVTKTLIPLAAIDDIIGVVVFFTVISIVNGMNGTSSTSPFAIAGMVLLPFIIGIIAGICAAFLIKRTKNNVQSLILLLAFLCLSALCGLLIDKFVFI